MEEEGSSGGARTSLPFRSPSRPLSLTCVASTVGATKAASRVTSAPYRSSTASESAASRLDQASAARTRSARAPSPGSVAMEEGV